MREMEEDRVKKILYKLLIGEQVEEEKPRQMNFG